MQSSSDRNLYATAFTPSDLTNAFKAPQDAITSRVTQYLPPVTTLPVLKADAPSNTLNFQIPNADACIDTRTVRLHLNLQVTVTNGTYLQGWVRLDNAGWGAMISQINLLEGNQLVEQITDASVLQAMLNQQVPEDYQEGVLAVTEGTNYVEQELPYVESTANEDSNDTPIRFNAKKNLYGPTGRAGGKYLMLFTPANDLTAAARGDTTLNTSTSINLPLGMFNTNKPIHSYMLNALRLEVIFNPIKSFLVWPTGHLSVDKTTVKITNAELRYDLLSLSPEFRSQMLEVVRELGSFEYPFDSYRMSENFLTTSSDQIIKISGSGGSLLQSITFGFIEKSSTTTDVPSQSYFEAMGVQSYYFSVGGLRVPSHDIVVRQLGTGTNIVNQATQATNAAIEYTEDVADGFIETIKSQGLYKSYAIGQKGNSSKSVSGHYAANSGVVGDRRLYSYSFTQSYDQEALSGFVLGDNSEISLVLKFWKKPEAGTRCIIALNYGMKHVFTADGRTFTQG
jgi:hypothetical protein